MLAMAVAGLDDDGPAIDLRYVWRAVDGKLTRHINGEELAN
jgi:hypothetical protein